VALSPKQALFAREYLVDRNATQAALRAGYSAKTAKSQGARLLTYADVKAAVDAGTVAIAEKLELSAVGVLKDIIRLSETAEQNGELGTALKGRELLGKHLKLFTDKLEVEGKLSLEQLVMAATARRRAGP
jgi:phage terminase small subunit